VFVYLLLSSIFATSLWSQDIGERIDRKEIDPATMIWHKAPVDKWENSLPVGNGRPIRQNQYSIENLK